MDPLNNRPRLECRGKEGRGRRGGRQVVGEKYMYIKEMQPALLGLHSDSVCRKIYIRRTAWKLHGFCKKWPTCMRENPCRSVYIAAMRSWTFLFWTSFRSTNMQLLWGQEQNVKTTKYLHFILKLISHSASDSSMTFPPALTQNWLFPKCHLCGESGSS